VKNTLLKLIHSVLLSSLIILIFSSNNLYSQEANIRVVKKNAVLRLTPNSESLVIKELHVGTVLNAVETIGEWVKVKLPADKDGIVVTGYIHNSYIEFEIKPVIIKPEKIIATPEKKSELSAKKIDKDYLSWKNDLSRAKGKSSTGSILTSVGGLVFVPCMILTFVHMETKYEYGYWGLVQYEKKKARAPYLIGDAIGLVTLIFGLAIHLPAHGEVKRLENEGRIEGYLTAGLLPKYRAIGIQLELSF